MKNKIYNKFSRQSIFLDIHEKKKRKKIQFGYYLVCLFVFVFVLCFVFDTIIKNVVINFLMIFFFNTYIPETCYFTSETIYTVSCKKLTVHKTNRFDHKSYDTVQKLIVLSQTNHVVQKAFQKIHARP